MKTNIIKVDTNKLNETIDVYATQYGAIPYLICSEDTEKLIAQSCTILGSAQGIKDFREKGKISSFCGCKILTDNDITIGEIEVR